MLIHKLAFLVGFSTALGYAHITIHDPESEVEYPYDFTLPEQIPFHVDAKGVKGHQADVEESKTIYQVLSDDPKFSRLTKILKHDKEMESLLNDKSAGITFFATPNSALRRPRKHPRKGLDDDILLVQTQVQNIGQYDLPEIVELFEELEVSPVDDDDKEKRIKFLKKILHAILSYHVLPIGLNVEELSVNTTYATTLVLPDGSLAGQPLRIRTQRTLVPPKLLINLFSTIIGQEVHAINGIVHAISSPLFPPPSVFQEAFILPDIFATFTSAVQRTGLTDKLDLRYIPGKDGKKGSLQGTTATTLFLPANRAFRALPRRLQLFLFSPFGEYILKKLLQYHIVPDLVLHSDYLYNATSGCNILNHDDSWTSPLAVDNIHHMNHASRFWGVEAMLGGHHIVERQSLAGPRGLGCPIEVPPLPVPLKCPRPPFRFGLHEEHSPVRIPGCNSPSEVRHIPGCVAPAHHIPHLPRPEPISSINFAVPTLLANHSLNIHVAKFRVRLPVPGPNPPSRISNRFFVNGQEVPLPDLVARNGAIHLITRLISPRTKHRKPHHPRHGHDAENGDFHFIDEGQDDWEDWEEWLPQWAAEN